MGNKEYGAEPRETVRALSNLQGGEETSPTMRNFLGKKKVYDKKLKA